MYICYRFLCTLGLKVTSWVLVKTLYLDSGKLLIAKDMKIPKASLPFLLQDTFLKKGRVNGKTPVALCAI